MSQIESKDYRVLSPNCYNLNTTPILRLKRVNQKKIKARIQQVSHESVSLSSLCDRKATSTETSIRWLSIQGLNSDTTSCNAIDE